MDGVQFEDTGGAVEANTRRTAMSRVSGAGAANLVASWPRIAARLRAEFGEDLYSSWFARMEPEALDGAQLTVSLPTRFLRNWVMTHYSDRLLRICEAEFGALDLISIEVRMRGATARPVVDRTPKRQAAAEAPTVPLVPMPAVQRTFTPAPGSERGSPLDQAQTFDSFIVGRSNALAQAAAMRVADAPAGVPLSFNPLVIHSSAGLGKTHLLNAIAWHIRQRNPNRRVLYSTAERFMYNFMGALRARDMLSFKDQFQGTDVLLIDDFQFLQGKSMQQEFCHTFNSLVDAKRQVVVAADLPPSQLESIDQRMRSRLAGGLVVDIGAPDIELRRDILRARLVEARRADRSLAVPDEVVEFIANRITGGGRELDGALNRVIADHQLKRVMITVDLAAAALRDLAQPSEPQRVRIDDIQKVVGHHYNVARADLLSPRRARSIVRPRQIAMYLAKKLTSRSLPDIGRRFGGRDHSTVLHAVRKIEDLIKADEKFAREISLLIRLIEQQ